MSWMTPPSGGAEPVVPAWAGSGCMSLPSLRSGCRADARGRGGRRRTSRLRRGVGGPEDVVDVVPALFQPNEAEPELGGGVADQVVGLLAGRLDLEQPPGGPDVQALGGERLAEQVAVAVGMVRSARRRAVTGVHLDH